MHATCLFLIRITPLCFVFADSSEEACISDSAVLAYLQYISPSKDCDLIIN